MVALGSQACVIVNKLIFYDALGLCW